MIKLLNMEKNIESLIITLVNMTRHAALMVDAHIARIIENIELKSESQ